jgi:hypothetical protein
VCCGVARSALAERVVHRFGQVEAMHLEPVHFKLRHVGKRAHLRGIAFNAGRSGFAPVPSLCPAARPASTSDAAMRFKSHSKGPRMVSSKVVDVEDQPTIGRGECAQVAHMRVAAKLAHDARRGKLRQVRGHHRRCAAKIAEWRLGHELVFETGISAGTRPRIDRATSSSAVAGRALDAALRAGGGPLVCAAPGQVRAVLQELPSAYWRFSNSLALQSFVQGGFSFGEKPLSVCGSRVGQL